MHTTLDGIRIAMKHIADAAFISLEPIQRTHYTLDDIVDQAIMDLIVIDYQMSAPRKSLRQHCIDHGMPVDGKDNRDYMRLSRRMYKANHYKGINAEMLERSAGVRVLDFTENDMSGPSNYHNAYTLTNVDFHELQMQDGCKLLQKIFEHKVSNKNGTPNPQFKLLFTEYDKWVTRMASSAIEDNVDVAIERTIELFRLQRAYNIEFFYTLTLEAERHGFPQPVPTERVSHLCASIPVIPPSPHCCVVVLAAEQRMFMVRDSYCRDVFTLADDKWEEQAYGMVEACRLKTLLIRPMRGRGFISYIHKLSQEEKLYFMRNRYWLWDKCVTFDWSNRKRIQYMRELFAKLTQDMPGPQKNS